MSPFLGTTACSSSRVFTLESRYHPVESGRIRQQNSAKYQQTLVAYFRKSGGFWRAEIRRVGHPDISQSGFRTKGEAAAWASVTEGEILAGKRRDIPDKCFGDLLDKYALEVSAHKKGARWESVRIGLLKRDALASARLRRIDATDVAGWRDRRLKSVSEASVRREWNLLSHACNIAVREWRWLKENPFQGVRRPKGGRPRERLPTKAEMEALQKKAESDNAKKALAAFQFSTETGMRASELCGLEHINGTVARLQDTKNGTARDVPLSARAIEIWQAHGPFGIKPSTLDVNWRKLCKAAGVKDLHFHDSRHVAITQLAQKLDVLELARMVGIKDLRVLMVYYNKPASEIAKKL